MTGDEMTGVDDPVVGWVLTQVEYPVDDPAGFLAEWIDEEDHLPESDQAGTAVVVLDDARRVARLRRLMTETSSVGRRVVVVAPPDTHGNPLAPADVLGMALEFGLGVHSLRHFDSGWGLTLLPSGGAGWARLAVSELERADEIEEALRKSSEELAALHRELATALDQQRRLLAEIDEATVRGAGLEEEMRRLQRIEESERVLRSQISVLSEERSRLTEDAADLKGTIASLKNQVELLRRQRSHRESALKKRQDHLLADRTKLRYRLELEKWKRRGMGNRRWWVLGRFLSGLVRRPLDVGGHMRLFRQLLRPPAPEPRPSAPPELTAADTESLSAPAASGGSVVAVSTPGQRRSLSASGDLIVAGVLDEMSHASFDPECTLLSFTPDNWQEVLTSTRPDLLLVESAWKGNQGSWEYQVGSYSHPESIGLPRLRELVDWCRHRGVPTVFWNKEDPVHFDKFKEAAALFDVVFTTDLDRVDAYRSLDGLRAHTVRALPFAAQPRLHYPAPLSGRIESPVFAGTFYRNRHPERRRQLEMLLDGALDQGLVIYDRMGGQVSDSFGYPDRFRQAIVGGVPYTEMVEVYRRHRVFLNTNSVVDSPTMFSRRVFELLACGTPVVSTVSRGVSVMFGAEVLVATSQDEAREEISRLIHDDAYWMSVSGRGVEAVAREHLYSDRLRTIAEAAEFELPPVKHVAAAEPVAQGNDGPWRLPEQPSTYVLFGENDGAAWVGRLVEADVVGYTDDPALAYTWVEDRPVGDFAVRATLLASGWTPDDPLPVDTPAFLIPR